MMRRDGVSFNRETERERWDYVEALETELLRQKTVFETVSDMAALYDSAIGYDADEEDGRRARIELQARLRTLASRRGSRG